MSEKIIIRNAKLASERDGYNYIVYCDNNGNISFTRLYDNLNLFDVSSKNDIICVINPTWNRGIYVSYISYFLHDIELTIKKYNIKFMKS